LTLRDFDLLVIGGGSGGVRAARVAAELGARVALVEADKFGGTCVNLGCIPKKLLVLGAEFAHAQSDARGFGWQPVSPAFDWSALIAGKNGEVARLNQAYERTLRSAGVTILRGWARCVDAHHVRIDARTVSCEHVLLATGSVPRVPQIPGCELAITSDQAFHLPALPARVAIVGGGYVAVEFAAIFHGFGARVEIVQRGGQILGGFDRDARDHMAGELRKQGIAIRCPVVPSALERRDGELRLQLSDGSVLACDQVLFATGRVPRTSDLGLAALGVRLAADGAVEVDDYSRSSLANLLAVGDCAGGPGLTPVAIADGQAAAHTLFGAAPQRRADRDKLPTALFGLPPLAAVGLSEDQARARGLDVEIYRSVFTPLKHRLSGRDEKSLVKLVVERASQRVIGCHMVGEGAAEIMQGFAVALQCNATKAQFDATVAIHPTAAEELVTLRSPVAPGA
jgi:glutathione reductase (NADPH)